MNHQAVDNAFAMLRTRLVRRRGFHCARPLRLAASCSAALALALLGPGFTASARAQTMGEYGGVTAQGAAGASSMPKIGAPSIGGRTGSTSSNSAGAQHREETRTYDDPPSNDRSRDDRDTDKNDDSPGDWQQVK